ncbi:MAG: hypothetical protein EBV03_07150 [Proteobacteria bacterium]|nr:hypothetical protein [Pseudomonadota bacterium]
MAGIIYTLCALTALLCTLLLFRAYCKTHNRLLLWGSLCFVGLTVNNIMVVLDKMVVETDLSTWRLVPALAGLLVFLYGLILETE